MLVSPQIAQLQEGVTVEQTAEDQLATRLYGCDICFGPFPVDGAKARTNGWIREIIGRERLPVVSAMQVYRRCPRLVARRRF